MHSTVKHSLTNNQLYALYYIHDSVHNMLCIPWRTYFTIHTHINFYAISTILYVLYYTHKKAHTVHAMLYTPVFYDAKHIVHTVLTFLAVHYLLCHYTANYDPNHSTAL